MLTSLGTRVLDVLIETARRAALIGIVVGLAAAGLAAASLIARADAATYKPAVDHRPCVDAREFNGYHVALTKADLEARWEVKGLGRSTTVPEFGRAVIYPRCGYSMRQAWYGVRYVPDQAGQLWGVVVIWWHRPTEQPDPEPAAPAVPPGPPQLIPARSLG